MAPVQMNQRIGQHRMNSVSEHFQRSGPVIDDFLTLRRIPSQTRYTVNIRILSGEQRTVDRDGHRRKRTDQVFIILPVIDQEFQGRKLLGFDSFVD
ncbi:hypothetical protein D3C73_1424500 [compost metagenome]